MPTPKPEKPRGLLRAKKLNNQSEHARFQPSDDLAFWIEHYWWVAWDLRHQPSHKQEVLSHPSVHMVFEKNHSRIVGVVSQKFTRVLEGQSSVFGVKFKPGAFYSFLQKSVSSFTDTNLAIEDVFGDDGVELIADMLARRSMDRRIDRVESFLRKHRPEKDEAVALIHQITRRIIEDPTILKVDDILTHFPVSKRSLQRLFNAYVGVSPKWCIKRYRMHEVVEQLDDNPNPDWAQLALELGYFDQAHFIKDFKAIIGFSPARYFKQGNDSR